MERDRRGLVEQPLLLNADCRIALPVFGAYDLLIVDPPYGDTSLSWDRKVRGWEAMALACLKPTGSMWVFGSMRYFLAEGVPQGFRLAQDIVWEKHNGSGFSADRFRRVHEHVVQFYRADSPWGGVFNAVQTTADATARTVRRKKRPAHTGHVEASHYTSVDGGPRLRRSVVQVRSMHGRAIHPTEKPVELLDLLIRTSCPPGGRVGDPFAGSAAVGAACQQAQREYVGCEIDPAYFERGAQRLRQT